MTGMDCGVLQVIAVVTTVPEKLNNMQNFLQRNGYGKYQAKVVLAVVAYFIMRELSSLSFLLKS